MAPEGSTVTPAGYTRGQDAVGGEGQGPMIAVGGPPEALWRKIAPAPGSETMISPCRSGEPGDIPPGTTAKCIGLTYGTVGPVWTPVQMGEAPNTHVGDPPEGL